MGVLVGYRDGCIGWSVDRCIDGCIDGCIGWCVDRCIDGCIELKGHTCLGIV